ncbi:hypothetical protein L226DRAFT_53475 [Lentinus tigrinus ALCF2SS1-7]|uniref:Uncharacterized protein n=1 Tax=Lentinus tigrinus ALCF2SS1-6 TaxID=1328759 RepID=A0A5C2SAX2_9APHY|nr:hypothetical protein L227DRAFT_72438 [Lentinus tigrinus ALCF2SS1-6]RPD75046.1 hypothetical protein L226DRAFT_53475 [Lentinus tigrinus ALCF2SS1-7]
MADVRALLKAKRQEVRITHPLATYTSSGQLRCVACGTAVKHASAWEGHIGSKSHRTNAARLREERAREAQRAAEEQESLKRKAMEVDEDEEDVDEDTPMVDAKRRRTESEEPHPIPSAPAAPAASSKAKRGALPADFFSDPSMAPPPAEDDEDEDDANGAGQGAGAPTAPAQADGKQDVLDLEWQRFQQSVLNAPDYQETYERATVAAEPVLAAEVPQGFPSASGAEGVVDGEGERHEELDEEAKRRRKEQDERELIMDRLMEEEQAQEEADARVSVLKNKLEALKRNREAARAAKAKKTAKS